MTIEISLDDFNEAKKGQSAHDVRFDLFLDDEISNYFLPILMKTNRTKQRTFYTSLEMGIYLACKYRLIYTYGPIRALSSSLPHVLYASKGGEAELR